MNKLYITNGDIYAEDGVYRQGVLAVDRSTGKIAGIEERHSVNPDASDEVVDARGLRVIPGLIDEHIHGLQGLDMMEHGLDDVAVRLARFGVTGFLATTLATPMDYTLESLKRMTASAAWSGEPAGARPLGIHLEGPFLSPKTPGMMNPEHFLPLTVKDFDTIYQACEGRARMMTLAPEVDDALEVIPEVVRRGVIASIGHTTADFEMVGKAVRAGVTHATHTCNAMKGLHHREPGTLGGVLYYDQITCEIIADAEHVHPAVIQMIIRTKGLDRVVLVSDAAPLACLAPGEYNWGEHHVINTGLRIQKPDGTLAGSAVALNRSLHTLVERLGMPLEQALISAARTPARELHLDDRMGTLKAGKLANIAILAPDYSVKATYVEGRCVHNAMQAEKAG